MERDVEGNRKEKDVEEAQWKLMDVSNGIEGSGWCYIRICDDARGNE